MSDTKITDEIALEINRIAESMRKLQTGKLNQRCIIILLRDITGINMTDIKAVLNGAAELDKRFLKRSALKDKGSE